jgi:serine protease AprX
MLNRARMLLVLVAAAVASVPSVQPHYRWRGKLDRALVESLERTPSQLVRTLIRTRNGGADEFRSHIAELGARGVRLSSTPDLLVAELRVADLGRLAADPDVLRVSLDAPVKGLASSLSSNTLLGTEGLLTSSGTLATPYKGSNIGVAVIDSGVTAGDGDLSAITFYDVTNKMKQGGNYDDFGHGTHVSGLIASNGSFSNYLYQGMAPSVQLIEMKVLDSTGNGYTSDVIDAINYVVVNRSRLHLAVINLSLGHPIYESASTDPLVQAVENAIANGIVVVVSAGNFGGDPTTHEAGYGGITSPGNAPDAITVGAVETMQTNTRDDDSVAWYSSRGPTWYDGYQKPDVLAPGSHLVSDASTKSWIFKNYPGGVVKAAGKLFMRMSGTSMSAPVVSGIVAAMLDANRGTHPGQQLTPNAVKAILQYTAISLADEDVLSQGAGAVNAMGAIALAAAVDPGVPSGAWWLSTPVNPWTTIDGTQYMWVQRVVWGDRVVWGNQVYYNDPAWALRVVWGDRVIWGNRVVWGNSTVWDGNQVIWGNRVVWGNTLIGESTGNHTDWGGLDSTSKADRVVWGDLQSLAIAPTSILSGNLERANMDIK